MARRTKSQFYHERKPKTILPPTAHMRKSFGLNTKKSSSNVEFVTLPAEIRNKIYGYIIDNLQPERPKLSIWDVVAVIKEPPRFPKPEKEATPKPMQKAIGRRGKQKKRNNKTSKITEPIKIPQTPFRGRKAEHKGIIAFLSTCRTVRSELAPKYFSAVAFIIEQRNKYIDKSPPQPNSMVG
ncbi:hypothetical protein EJ08DRAFT_120960 [Tothia fuscella]|uniref:Uncharacterized protein n=1 Tax=Tothia fuscella TaxID=1048955 RepID=A0A9P4NVL9_9PEZI|nr:hypothetical protein EJ08DRAFT_120960 [Tothia fuscella]